MSKKKIVTITAYLLFLLLSFFYVKQILKEDEVYLYEEKEERDVPDKFLVNVTFKYSDGKKTTEFKKERTNFDSVEELLRDLRSKDGLTYEKNNYTYGTEILSVFGITPQDGYKWAVYFNGKDITNKVESTYLEKDSLVELKLVKK